VTYLASEARHTAMAHRRSGRSGLLLPAVSVGLSKSFGEDSDLRRQRSVLRRAFDLGVTHFDTADHHGPPPGSAESNLGQVLARDFAGHRDELAISTKAGARVSDGPHGAGGSRKRIVSALDASLRRLGVDYVDVFYHHRPDTGTPVEETMAALDHVVRQGKALYVGLADYPADETREAAKILDGLGTPLTVHQFGYSLLDRWPEADLLGTLAEAGAGVVTHSPLADDVLAERYLSGLTYDTFPSAGATRGVDPSVPSTLRTVHALDEIAARRGQSLPGMAIAWALRRCTSVVVHAQTPEEVEAAVAATEALDFADDELTQIDLCLRS
jgi:L-glyceraldehyde 3-phosphate reductase